MYSVILTCIGLPVAVLIRIFLQGRLYGCLGFLNRKAQHGKVAYVEDRPPISVIIPAHNQADQLERFLPEILEQEYPDFEVIVVNDTSTDHTEEVLKGLSQRYSNLYHTFTPPSARYVSHKKLAITLGVKAARHEWIVMSKADCHPASRQWLERLARNFTPHTSWVLGYANYEQESGCFNRTITFDRLMDNLQSLSRIIFADRAFNGDGCNMAFRKSLFLEHKGYQQNLQLKRGEDSLLINETAQPGKTRVECSPESVVRQEPPYRHKTWRTDKVFQMETRRHFRQGRFLRYIYGFMSLLTYLCYALIIRYAVIGMSSRNYVLCAIAGVCLITMTVGSILSLRQSTRSIGERSFYLSLLWYELTRPFQTAYFKLRRGLTTKGDFLRR